MFLEKARGGYLKKCLKLWPFATTALVVWWNVEIVAIPYFKSLGLSYWETFCWSVLSGNLELFYYYWFIGWFGIFLSKNSALQNFYKDLKAEGFIRHFKRFIRWLFERFEPDNDTNKRKILLLKASLRGGGYITMFLLGSFIGSWIPALILCRSTKWYIGLFFLFLGNTFKIAYFVGGWSFVFWLFS